jgi:peptidylprolyl isomerase
MAPKPGDTVRVHYRGTLADGTEFDCSEGRDPLQFEVGSGQVIPGFDTAVCTLESGGTTVVTIVAAEAYGDRDDQALQSFPMDFFGGQIPEVGWAVELATEDGQRVPATVVEVANGEVVLDFNHPLAGQDLTFEITLVEIVEG